MRLHRPGVAALGTALVATVVLAGCTSSSSGGSNQAARSKPLKIGMSLPLSGPVADVAKAGYQGYQLWAAQVNATGGLLGRKVRLVVLDDGFDPNTTVSDYTRLISQDRVDLLLGTFSSLLNAPASAVAARQHMLYVEPSGGSAQLFTRGFTNLFFAQPSTTTSLPDQFVRYVSNLAPPQRPTTAALITADDPSASPAIAVFKQKFDQLGIRTVYNQTYSPSTSNFDTIAAAVARAKPDVVVQGALASDGTQFVRSLEKLSFTPKLLFQTNSPADPGYPAAIGTQNAQGVFTGVTWNSQAKYPGNAEFVAAFTNRFGTAPTEDAANSYTAGQVLAAAVKAVGRIDQSALASWLHSHTVQTIVGPLRWDSTGVPEGTLLLAQWQNGVLQIVAPTAAATTHTVINPKPAWTR